jgi:hypothetical protein
LPPLVFFCFRRRLGKSTAIIAFSTSAFKRCDESALDLNRGEPLIEETYRMSMQSHLAELEKRHQALEQEINECLTHPAVDDLRIVELKRRKLLVKDEIERLRHNGKASVH